MRHPVRGIGGGRHIAALHLVKALCAGLDLRQPAFDGKFDGLIVTGLEMQAGDIKISPPIAPEQRIAANEVQRAADDPRGIPSSACQHGGPDPAGHGGI